VQRFPDGLVLKAHRLLQHSTLGVRVIKKKKKKKKKNGCSGIPSVGNPEPLHPMQRHALCRVRPARRPNPYRGTSLIRKRPPPQDHHRALGRGIPSVGSVPPEALRVLDTVKRVLDAAAAGEPTPNPHILHPRP